VVPAAALLSLLQALMAVLVVDLAGLGIDKGFVSFGDFNELVMCCLIVAGEDWVSASHVLAINWEKSDIRVLVRVIFLA